MIDINLEITDSNKSDINQNFDKIIEIIENSRRDAFKAVRARGREYDMSVVQPGKAPFHSQIGEFLQRTRKWMKQSQ